MTQPQQHQWWNTATVRNWAWEMWRYYSWRPTYRLTLTTGEATAYVDMKNKQVVCNPEYPYPPQALQSRCRHLPNEVQDFQLAYLESLIAHEAGHTHHSGDLPAGLLGQLVNIIEDERMERLIAQDFQQLTRLFQMAADVDAAHAIHSGGRGGDLIRGCLLHRFTWHHPTWAYVPDGPDAPHWPEVKRILEAAWVAPTYPEVIEAARQILAILSLPEEAPKRDDLAQHLDGEGQQLLAILGQGSGTPQGTTLPADADPAANDETQVSPDAPDSGDTDAGRADATFGQGSGYARPADPVLDPSPSVSAQILHAETEGHARSLTEVMRRKDAPHRTQTSRDRGRFRADRYLTGSDRPFDLKAGDQRPGETHLRLAIDISVSMNMDQRLTHARRLAYTCVRAAQQAGMPVVAVAFDHGVHPLITPSTLPQKGLNAVANLRATGDTALAPALSWLWSHPLPGKSLTVVLTDGELSPFDYTLCQELQAKHDGFTVPILLSESDTTQAAYEETFGRCVRMTDPALLAGHVLSYLRGALKTS